ncbi:MAG: proton-conducting transporter membrane subunit [Gemmatimonadota bacterium]
MELAFLEIVPGLRLHLRGDALGTLFAATAGVLWLLVLPGPRRGRRYEILLALSFVFVLGIAAAGNLLTLLVFYELLSLAAWPLIVHDETPEALAAGRRYLAYVLAGSATLLLGLGVVTMAAGDVDFGTRVEFPGAGLVLLLAGFSVKAALLPVHGWVPRAHPVAPAPISALLSGLMVGTGSFGMIRVIQLVDPPPLGILGGVSALTVVTAGLMAIRTDHLKRRLAWSTISQMAYVPLALSVLHREALAGGILHITHHAFMKGGLFLCAGLLVHHLGIRRVSEMAGVARRMPWTMGAFTLLSLGMIGIPPLSGFVSKWVMGVGMVQAGAWLPLVVLLTGALLAALYLMPIVQTAWFDAPEGGREDDSGGAQRTDPPPLTLVPVLVAASLTVLLGVGAAFPGFPLELARLAARGLGG